MGCFVIVTVLRWTSCSLDQVFIIIIGGWQTVAVRILGYIREPMAIHVLCCPRALYCCDTTTIEQEKPLEDV